MQGSSVQGSVCAYRCELDGVYRVQVCRVPGVRICVHETVCAGSGVKGCAYVCVGSAGPVVTVEDTASRLKSSSP